MGRRGTRTALASRAAGLACGAAALATLVSGCAAGRPVVLEIGSPAGDATYVRRTLQAGDTVTYRFVHSVSRTPVEETWAVVRTRGGPALRLRAIRYRATGAGLPSGPEAPEARFQATADGFLLTGLDRRIGLPLDMRVAASAENALTVGDERIDLTRFPGRAGGGTASLLRLHLH